MADIPRRSLIFRFDPALSRKDVAKIRDNVSAIVLDGERLWLGGDEGTAVHRMTRDPSGDFGTHVSFDLEGTLGLPGPAKEEIDIEGLDVDDGYLWLIGSHSAKRKKAEDDKTTSENLARLATVAADGNRFTLARVPLDDSGAPVASHGARTAARLEGDTSANLLTKALATDLHVGRFVPVARPEEGLRGVPSKDNGLDVEGLAISGNRVFLGLRGPVLRGWAIVVELRLEESANATLTLGEFGESGRQYLKHFLQLDGLGVRDLVIQGNDILVLAGPSMDLDGPVHVFRWTNALLQDADSLTWNQDLPKVVRVPFGVTKDHAEGLSLVPGTPLSVLVCYDSPAASRIVGDHGVKADVFEVA